MVFEARRRRSAAGSAEAPVACIWSRAAVSIIKAAARLSRERSERQTACPSLASSSLTRWAMSR